MKRVSLTNVSNFSKDSYTKFQLLIVFMLILLSKSLYYETFGTNALLFPFLLLLSFFVVKYKYKISQKLIVFSMAFLFLVLINPNANYSSVAVLIIRFFIGILFVSLVPFKNFTSAFIDIMKLLSFASLFSLFFFAISLPSILPDFVAIDGRVLNNYLLFGIYDKYLSMGVYRNGGLWWEPGAFQVFVNLALIFSVISKTLDNKTYALFSITILSTFSTTGILCLVLISLIYFKSKLNSKNGYLYFIAFIFLFYALYSYIGDAILNKILYSSGESFSFTSRLTDLKISVALFWNNLWIGYGFANLYFQETTTALQIISQQSVNVNPTGADGITMFISQLGMFSIVFLLPFFWPKYLSKEDFITKIIVFICMFLMFNTQNFIFIIIFNVLTFYGIVGYKCINQHKLEVIN